MVELLVVMGVILMLLLLALPNIRALLEAGSFDQARAVMAGALSTARAVALENQTYALLHVQPKVVGFQSGINITDEFWMVTMVLDPATGKFTSAKGYHAVRLPRDVGAGEVNANFITSGQYDTKINGDPHPLAWEDFTSFNVIFAPDGSLVEDVNGKAPVLDLLGPAFGGDNAVWGRIDLRLINNNEPGTRAITFFDYKKLNVIAARAAELNESGQFLVINPYTGRLVDTE